MNSIVTIVIVVIGIAVLVALTVWILYMRKRRADDEQIFEDMGGQDFENYCAELLEAGGFENVETTPGSHDYGVDIIADRDGISYAIQCKCYSDAVGIKAIQEAYAGKDYYGTMIGVVMTNQVFTKSAVEFAAKLNILLWDGDYIMKLIHQVAIPGKKEQKKRTAVGIRRRIRIKDVSGEDPEDPEEEDIEEAEEDIEEAEEDTEEAEEDIEEVIEVTEEKHRHSHRTPEEVLEDIDEELKASRQRRRNDYGKTDFNADKYVGR